MNEYPEHEKLKLISDKSHAIGDFIKNFLPTKGIYLVKEDRDGRSYPDHTPIQDLLAEFFHIDQVKLEEEKRTMLDIQRLRNQ